jgi:tetratricopeptide (TPR) repeat protein
MQFALGKVAPAQAGYGAFFAGPLDRWTAIVMTIRLLLLLGLIFSVALTASCLAANVRLALVIGNARYPDADALDSRGLLNLKSGAAKNAIADFDAALKINPRLTSSLYGLGLAKQHNGAVSEGALDIANAKAMDPNIVQEFKSYGVS